MSLVNVKTGSKASGLYWSVALEF